MAVHRDMSEAFAEIQGHLVEATGDLFEGYAFPVELVTMGTKAPATSGETVASIIGYAGDTMRGALVLVTSREVVTALQPEDLREELKGNDDAACDVLGEFSNMLLGRLKNLLLGRGVILMLATPTTAVGTALRIATPAEGTAAWHEFSSAAGPVFVRFDAMFDPDFALEDARGADTGAVAEGDLMMF